jgi:septal ring factor EnvC (AmiA/AmiB activator)
MSEAAERTEIDPVLGEYREQATALESALKAVRAVQSDIAETSKARESALGARQTLIDKAAADDEEAIHELSRLSSRGEVLQARLNSHATRLAKAEAELKSATATFAISYNSLFLMLRQHPVRDASARITGLLHPNSVKPPPHPLPRSRKWKRRS